MSIRVASIFGQAWHRQPFGTIEKLTRGAVWFTLFLGSMAARLVVALVPVWIFWSLTPALLVRDGGRGWRTLLLAGFAGVVIDGIVLSAVLRVGFPILLQGWMGFGPIGVAMTLMTWCGVLAIGWVAVVCTGAILSERHAPARDVVAFAQTAEGHDA